MTDTPATIVTVDNYIRAETALQLSGIQRMAKGVNRFTHARTPIRLDRQNAPRMNRDTIYSSAIVDLSAGATLSIPESSQRYLSLQVINEDHYTTDIFHAPGDYHLSIADQGSKHVAVIARILANPEHEEDMAEVYALQAQLGVKANAATTYTPTAYDPDSYRHTRELLQQLGAALPDAAYGNGRRDEVRAVRHLLITAMGWGGLPEYEVVYANEATHRPVGRYTLTVGAVPVDGFWSVSVYNAQGYFEENPFAAYSVNSVTAEADADGTVTLHFDTEPQGNKNFLYIMDGWSYVVRFYQPHQSIQDRLWSFPTPELRSSR